MTRPIKLKLGDRVQFWATFPYSSDGYRLWNSTRLKRETKQMVPGTVVSLDPLRVRWDWTGKNPNCGPAMEYPIGSKDSYERSCIRRLPQSMQRRCDNCLYGEESRCLPIGSPLCGEERPRETPLHKWRPVK